MECKSNTMENSNREMINLKIMNKESFVQLIQENKGSLYRLSKSIVKREADVEDAISETILKAYENMHKLRDLDRFKPWVMRILVNECYAILKKHKRIELQEDFTAYEGTYEDKTEDDLMYYVDLLEEEFRAVVVLFYYEDISIKDISKVLNISEGTVKSRLSRAKAKLKSSMENR